MTGTYNQFLELLATGDQEKMMQFLETHFAELPQEFQDKIIFGLFENTASKQLVKEQVLHEAQQQGSDIMNKLESAKKDFEEVSKIADLKADLQ